ncbi:MAG: nucleotidyltransferase family protein, partial [Desulfobacterales bacterium]|nr:nucleotidyltransferase family protein [Desulfobacterales bacterium]
MRVFVLAGGHGTRFHPYSEIIPKCLIPIQGTPISRLLVNRLLSQGFEDIVICVNRWAEPLFRHEFRDLPVKFSVTERPLGTAGELLAARDLVDGKFILQYGDDLTRIGYEGLVSFHLKNQADVTLAVTRKVPLEVGVVEVTWEGRITALREKPFLGRHAWAAVSVFEPVVLEYCGVGKDLAKDVVPKMIEDKRRVYAYEIDSIWLDVGSIGHYRLANELVE